jgi:hypothetical protein
MGSWDQYRHMWQEVLNEHDIPPRRAQRNCNVAVTARLVWERDGVELVETVAYAWAGDLVLVLVPGHRTRALGVWLDKRDVRRRHRKT